MKYIITATTADGNRIAGSLNTKTTRKSKLMLKVNAELQRIGYPPDQVKDIYVGILPKHTILNK